MNVKTLNKYDSWVKAEGQINLKANNPVVIAEVEPPKKMGMVIPAHPLFYAQFKDDSGNNLPPNTKLIFAGVDQSHDLPFQLSSSHYIKPWNDIPYIEQKNEKYAHNFVIDLRQNVTIEEKEKFLIVLISPSDVVLDWANSEFELSVYELTMEEIRELGYAGSEFYIE